MYSFVHESRAPYPSQGRITAWLLLITVRLGKLNKINLTFRKLHFKFPVPK